ncbi:mammalian cell entry protein (plasmid) [Mycolicibacterium psychrotolerans]|uniref:mammalian cell entry protein n=1 Tax=Mycolicibacterium psychrotolerans TaxID=216929 RepID=UPI003D67C1C6
MTIDSDAISGELREQTTEPHGDDARQRASVRPAIAIGLLAAVAVTGLAGWLGYRAYEYQRADRQQDVFLQAARQVALNLTTINYTEVDADVRRILDSATGTFREDFQNRSQPFIDVVRKAQSTTEGSIIEASVESRSGDQAQVLVAVNVKTSAGDRPEAEPRAWRIRITVQRDGGSTKASNVEFVS